MLSILLRRVQVQQGVIAGHGEHHISFPGLICRLVDDVAFVYLCSTEPMPLGLVVTGGTPFFSLPILPAPDYLCRGPQCMWYPPTVVEVPGERPGSLRISEQVTML